MSAKHVAIIIDGNRRYAKKHKLDVLRGHWDGAENVERLLDWVRELEIKELTLYTLSLDNLENRTKAELNELFKVIKTFLLKFKDDSRVERDRVRINFAGRVERLPEDLRKIIRELEEKSKNYDNYKLNFCIAYSGRDEIVFALEKLREKNLEVNEENIKKSLWIQDEPEIVIRTGGRSRMSDFMPFQTIYSEWFFLDKLWPEFSKEDLIEVLERFKSVERNFGK